MADVVTMFPQMRAVPPSDFSSSTLTVYEYRFFSDEGGATVKRIVLVYSGTVTTSHYASLNRGDELHDYSGTGNPVIRIKVGASGTDTWATVTVS
jgi:hypothetical protein